MYFSGHGVRVKGQQYAIGCDSAACNVNKSFVQELMSKLSNCVLILLMDACGDGAHAGASAHDLHLESLVKGVKGNEDNLNGNLIVCAYACEVCMRLVSVPAFPLCLLALQADLVCN